MLPLILLVCLLAGAVVFPFTDKLPSAVQRSLAVLPMVKIDPETERNAKDSSDWRLEMWRNVVPTIPQYLILGKGLSLDARDVEMFRNGMNAGGSSSDGSAMAGDYHNGPLSLIIQFGIAGVIGFIWTLAAGFRVLQRNYHFGDPSLLLINRVLFAYFIVKCIIFFLVFGSFYADLVYLVGPVGLSIALNGGVCSRVVEPGSVPIFNRLKLANATR
jgi:O-Antigen ligase